METHASKNGSILDGLSIPWAEFLRDENTVASSLPGCQQGSRHEDTKG